MNDVYVHGYDSRESMRLQDQATTLVDLLHVDTSYPPGSLVLEAGCGVGAQTVALARNSPGAQIISVDVSADSLVEARRRAAAAGLSNVQFQQADILELPFAAESFDHVFVCFVLEHLSRPVLALAALRMRLRPGGTITVIEGDHGSAYFHPDSESARTAIQCQVRLQRTAGGNALVGRQLYPLLIEGVRETAIEAGIVETEVFDAGIRDLYRTAEADGVFCYTFFKAVGTRAPLAEQDGPVSAAAGRQGQIARQS